MAVQKCLFIHGSAGAPTYAAGDMRNVVAALLGGTNFEAVSPGIGAVARGHGVLSGLAVSANGTPNNHVFVASGTAAVRGSQNNNQGTYVCPLDASFDITVSAAHATLDRKDLVVAQVKDGEFAAFAGQSVWTPAIVAGTPAGSPVDPTVPEDCLVLARLLVRDSTEAGGTIVRPQDITDLRVQAKAIGGITPVASEAAYPNPLPHDFIWDESVAELKKRNAAGSGWFSIAQDLSRAAVDWTASITFDNVTLGTGGEKYAHYMKIGRIVWLQCGFRLGTGGDVTAKLGWNLPFTPAKITPAGIANRGGIVVGRIIDPGGGISGAGTGAILDSDNKATDLLTASMSISDVWGNTSAAPLWNSGVGTIMQAWVFYLATS